MNGKEDSAVHRETRLKQLLSSQQPLVSKPKVVLVYLCCDGFEPLLASHVQEALAHFANRLMMMRASGSIRDDPIWLGLCLSSGGTVTELVDPKEYSLQMFHKACSTIHFEEDNANGAQSGPLFDHIRRAIYDKGIAEYSTKVLVMASRAAISQMDVTPLAALLDQASASLAEVTLVELECDVDMSPVRDRGNDAQSEGLGAVRDTTALCDTASYHNLDLIQNPKSLEDFLCSEHASKIVGVQSSVEVEVIFPASAGIRQFHCLSSPLSVKLDLDPVPVPSVCTCHGLPSLPSALAQEQSHKCAATNQFVTFQKASNVHQVGRTLWKGEGNSPAGAGKKGEMRAFKILERVPTVCLNGSVLQGTPFMFRVDPFHISSSAEDESNREDLWHLLLSCMKERKEFFLGASHMNLETGLLSLVPLNYALFPDDAGTCLLCQRLIASEEMLAIPTATVLEEREPPTMEQKSRVNALLDGLHLSPDVSRASLRLDATLADLAASMSCENFPALQMVSRPEPATPRAPSLKPRKRTGRKETTRVAAQKRVNFRDI